MSKKSESKKFVTKPNNELKVRTSKDGKYVIIEETKSWIYSSKYFETVLKNASSQTKSEASEDSETDSSLES